jgi:hypothetical protein
MKHKMMTMRMMRVLHTFHSTNGSWILKKLVTKKRRLESPAKSSIPTSALVVTEIVQQKQKTTATKPPKLSHRHSLSVLLPSLSSFLSSPPPPLFYSQQSTEITILQTVKGRRRRRRRRNGKKGDDVVDLMDVGLFVCLGFFFFSQLILCLLDPWVFPHLPKNPSYDIGVSCFAHIVVEVLDFVKASDSGMWVSGWVDGWVCFS